jgi:hypothetical protein
MQVFKPGDRVEKGNRVYTITGYQGDEILTALDDNGKPTLLAVHEVLRCRPADDKSAT